MKAVRQLHLYLGAFCAPLIVYFCLSGAWQVFGFHDIPRGEPGTPSQRFFHAMSMPHTHSTLPGGNPRQDHSRIFDFAASLTALIMIASALLGLVLAWRFTKSPALVVGFFVAGALIPALFLFL
jgi:uncharacterized iron-regulated membrane protein